MKSLLSILLWLLPAIVFSQTKDSVSIAKINDTIPKSQIQTPSNNSKTPYKPEILTSGFIDIVNNGQVNASARFIRLYIGEPGKFAIPLSIYSGVSSNNFPGQQNTFVSRTNEQLVINFINPLSGLANLSIDGVIFSKKKFAKIYQGRYPLSFWRKDTYRTKGGTNNRSINWQTS